MERIQEIYNNDPIGSKPFQKPTIEEIRGYCIERGYTEVEAEKFYNYYEKNNWMVKYKNGKKKMENWKNSINTWVVNDIRYNQTNELRNKAREAYIRDVELKETKEKKGDSWFE